MSFEARRAGALASLFGFCASISSAAFMLGCGDDDVRLLAPGPEGAAGNEGATDPGAARYGLAVSVFNPDSSQTYLLTTTDLSARELDVRGQGIELQGYLFPFAYENAIFVPNEDGPTVTRYALVEGGNLEEGPTLSFASVGYASAMDSFNLPIINATKAYAFDAPNSRAHLWNPQSMTLLSGEIDISMIQREGYVARIAADSDAARQQGSLLFVPVGWEDAVTEDARPASGMLVIDTDTDTVVKFLEDERCTEFHSSVRTASGDIYFFTSEHSIVTISGGNPEYTSCALRIRAGQSDFDPDFVLNLSELTGRPIACCGAWAGGESAYVPVLYEERVMVSDRRELWSKSNNDYRYWRIALDTGEAREVTSLPFFNTGGPSVYEMSDGRVYRPLTIRPEEGPDQSTLLELTAGEEPSMGITLQGSLTLFTRLP
jgi:hypothetical protein